MSKSEADLAVLLRTLDPRLNGGVYVYSIVPLNSDVSSIPVLATFRETEGMTVIASEEAAVQAGWSVRFRAAWITIEVHSDLQAVGLTAALSRALSEAGISCNVVAAACHDHIFVPVERAEEAMACLKALQNTASHGFS